jgi:hypothetical protein
VWQSGQRVSLKNGSYVLQEFGFETHRGCNIFYSKTLFHITGRSGDAVMSDVIESLAVHTSDVTSCGTSDVTAPPAKRKVSHSLLFNVVNYLVCRKLKMLGLKKSCEIVDGAPVCHLGDPGSNLNSAKNFLW